MVRRDRSLDAGCPLERSLAVLGDGWTLMIMREAFSGTRRFEGFRERLGIARNILSGRLQTLVTDGLLERALYQHHPDRYEYRLTEKGIDLYDALIALRRWGARWLGGDGGPERVLVHEKCGQPCNTISVCTTCGAEVAPTDLSRLLRGTAVGAAADANAP
jgi:DNA-binding HxlR family transcriptional regulator